jgi:hypothetical protein
MEGLPIPGCRDGREHKLHASHVLTAVLYGLLLFMAVLTGLFYGSAYRLIALYGGDGCRHPVHDVTPEEATQQIPSQSVPHLGSFKPVSQQCDLQHTHAWQMNKGLLRPVQHTHAWQMNKGLLRPVWLGSQVTGLSMIGSEFKVLFAHYCQAISHRTIYGWHEGSEVLAHTAVD